ncbi:MAG: HD domain-containing protein, partial [Kiritimatiellia bacterium]
RPPSGSNRADKQQEMSMKLSDLMQSGRQALDRRPSRNTDRGKSSDGPGEHFEASPGKTPSSVPPEQTASLHPGPEAMPEQARDAAVRKSEDSGVYDESPKAIYDAARQMEIPIPQNKHHTLQEARDQLSRIFHSLSGTSHQEYDLWPELRSITGTLSTLSALDSNFAREVHRYPDGEGRLTAHSINSAVIAMDLARDVKNNDSSPQDIGAASLVHDIGFLLLGMDFATLNEGDPAFKEHVNKAADLLANSGVPDAVVRMVSQHHESIDGAGFPGGISGNAFALSSQVVAIAEQFERLMWQALSNRQPDDNYVSNALGVFQKAFDPGLVKTLISLRGFYPDGIMVELTNRAIAMVIKQNPGFPLTPVVQVVIDSAGNHPQTPGVIDLRTSPLSITHAVTRKEAAS